MVKPEQDLLAASSDDDEEQGADEAKKLVINKRYAKDFQIRKQREDLRHNTALLDDHDDDNNDDDDEASSSEDEDGALLTTRLDTDIMKTIHALRSKDARIYDPKVRFFETKDKDDDKDDDDSEDDDDDDKKKQSNSSSKPKRYKDVVREQALEKIEKEEHSDRDDDDDDDNLEANDRSAPHRLAYDKEQEELRKSFLQSTKDTVDKDDTDTDENNSRLDDDEKDADGLLVVKKKVIRNEDEEKEFLEQVQRIESTLETSADYVDPKGEVDNGSKFLLSYFKNRAWIDKDDDMDDESDDQEEVARKASRSSRSKHSLKEQAIETDEVLPMKTSDNKEKDGNESDASLDHLDKSDDFEAQYNFRFEQATAGRSGADHSLMTYARGQTVDTLRRKDDSRREKRLARKERKAAERKAKEEELKRLKNLKRKEMERKLNEVKKVVGLLGDEEKDGGAAAAAAAAAGELDEAAIMKLIEGDYDPEEFEKKMQETFGDDFYAKQDKEWKSDKDVRESLMKDEDGNLLVGQDNDDGGLYDTVETEADEVENEDTENEHEQWDEEAYYDDEGEQAEDSKETELEKKIKSKMEDELYKLDYEDIIGGMPTRFKYRQVEPNDYGLTTEEILFSRDTTLKQFVSLKKMAPYREDGEFNVGGRRRRRFRDILKHEVEEELKESDQQVEPAIEETEGTAAEGTHKKRKRRRNKKSKHATSEGTDNETENEVSTDKEETSKAVGQEEEEADQAPQHKRKRRRSKKNKSATATEDGGQSTTSTAKESNPPETTPRVSDESSMDKPEESKDELAEVPNDTHQKPSKEKAKKKHKKHKHKEERHLEKKDKKKKKKSKIEGISTSRLSSYGM